MGKLQEPFTRKELSDALERTSGHPVHAMLDLISPAIEAYVNAYPHGTHDDDYTRDNFGFFLDQVAELSSYPLEPLDILSISARLQDSGLPRHSRYAAARAVSVRYASQDMEGASWDGAVHLFAFANDDQQRFKPPSLEVERFFLGLDRINAGLRMLTGYARQNLDSVSGLSKVIEETQENWANGLTPAYAWADARLHGK